MLSNSDKSAGLGGSVDRCCKHPAVSDPATSLFEIPFTSSTHAANIISQLMDFAFETCVRQSVLQTSTETDVFITRRTCSKCSTLLLLTHGQTMCVWLNSCKLSSLQVQNHMCDMMTEIDQERNLCEAQIENKTTGMRSFVLSSFAKSTTGSRPKWHNELKRQQTLFSPPLWLDYIVRGWTPGPCRIFQFTLK